MVLLSIINITNPSKFAVHIDDPLVTFKNICLLSVTVNFSDENIPDTLFLMLDEIDKRLINGVNSNILEIITKRQTNQLGYQTNNKKYVSISTDKTLNFSVVDANNNEITNLESIYLDLEVI